MQSDTDDRSAIAQGMGLVSQITTGSLMMVIPAAGGYWLDQWLGTYVLFLIIGFAVGAAMGGWHLYRIVASLSEEDS